MRKNNLILFLFISLLASQPVLAQKNAKDYQIVSVGFYNFENLFDTLDSYDTNDTEFTPQGSNRYTYERYESKLTNLSRVVSELGTEHCEDGLALLGVAEIENRSVLEDFVHQKPIRTRNYQIVHYDSPDRRGIDVALLYNPKYFRLEGSRSYPVHFISEGDTSFTRDILHVVGFLNGERTHVLVNHWPSRSGGEARTIYRRAAAADVCRIVYDSLRSEDPLVKVLLMGDLNDDPVSPSVKDHLRAVGKLANVEPYEMYNPMLQPFRKGLGSTAWRDSWSLFDQIILSYGYTKCEEAGYCFYKSKIYNPKYLRQVGGQYAGYPFRTYANGQFAGGYSDHFPVFVYLVKAIDRN
jgi:hypothetical protein